MIFYFSCTGNTKWAAEYLSKATGEPLIDIAKAPAEAHYHAAAGERVGFCFPIHGWRPPIIVREFISRLHITADNDATPFCYALCTAGDNVGEGMAMFKHDCEAVGIKIDSCASLLMPESYIGLPFMDVDKKEKEQQKKEQAQSDLQEFASTVMQNRRGVERLHIGNWPRINTRLLGSIFLNHIITDKPFRLNREKCKKCGRCIKSCPVANITTDDEGFPQWQHTGKCLSCFACYHHCPTHAIEYGSRTKGKGQYYYDKDKDVKS